MIIYIVSYEESSSRETAEGDRGESELSEIGWRTEVGRVAISVSTGTTIARLKYRYIRALMKRSGEVVKGYVSLLFHGLELVDERTLAQYRIADGDEIVHIINGRTGMEDVEIDYGEVADMVENTLDLEGDSSKYDREWREGEKWKSFPPVSFHNIWDTQVGAQGNEVCLSPKPKRKENASPRSPQHSEFEGGRRLKAGYDCVIQGSLFRVIHRMEGHWTGHMVELLPHRQQPKLICNCDLWFDQGSSSWVEERKLVNESRMSKRAHSNILPVSDGICVSARSSSDGPPGEQEFTRYQEVGDNVLVITTRSNIGGNLKRVETITLLDSAVTMRTRVTQVYEHQPGNESVQLVSMVACNERRVVTKETGGIVVPDFTL